MGAHCSSSNRMHVSQTITSTIGWSQLKWKVTADGYYMNTPTLMVKLHWSMPTTTNHTLAGEEVEIASHPPELFLQPEQRLSLSFNIQTFEDVCWCCMGRTITCQLLISMTTSAISSLLGGSWRLYQHTLYNGQSATYGPGEYASQPAIGNDQLSSVKKLWTGTLHTVLAVTRTLF